MSICGFSMTYLMTLLNEGINVYVSVNDGNENIYLYNKRNVSHEKNLNELILNNEYLYELVGFNELTLINKQKVF